MGEAPVQPLEFSAHYALLDATGKELAGGEATLQLDDEGLGVKPASGQARRFPLRDVSDLVVGDFVVNLLLGEDGRLALSMLGHDYENFQRALSARRSDLLLRDLLMEEALVMDNLHASYEHTEPDGARSSGEALLRLYQTALVVIPLVGTPLRIPFSDITETQRQDYRFLVRTELGDNFLFSQLGRDLDPLEHTLGELSQNLALKTQAVVKELMPSASQSAVLTLAGLMKEGRAARRRDIEAIDPKLWGELEQWVLGSKAADEYKVLKSLGQGEDTCIGLKRSLKEGAADYLWFMVPFYSTDHKKPGNAVVMEAISADNENRATYVFRLVGRKQYPELKTGEALQAAVGSFLKTVNRALVTINFRREPIYLSKEALLQPQYKRYRYSVAALPELRTLRWLFIGRVIHNSSEQWKADLQDLLVFNTSTTDDKAIWVKKTAEESPS